MVIIINNIKEFIEKNNKIKIIGLIAMIIIGIIVVTIFKNNYSMYDKTIAKITNVVTEKTEVKNGPNGEREQYYKQEIIAEIKNGTNKGEEVQIINTYSYSLIETQKYDKGDSVFVNVSIKDGEENIGRIVGLKRDTYLVTILVIFIIALIAIADKYGVITIFTIIFNMGAMVYFIKQYIDGGEFNTINNVMVLTLTIVTLSFIGGFSRKTLGAIVSTILTLYTIYAIYLVTLHFSKAPHYELIEYQLGAMDIESITLLGMIVGCLGAVMDVCITINSCVNELLILDKNISIKAIVKSIKEIGYDVMGTMINVLMFSYVGGSLIIILIKLANGYSMQSLMKFDYSFEIIRFLIGAIGIVVSVPISGFIAILLLKKGWRK